MAAAALAALAILRAAGPACAAPADDVRAVVDQAVRPLMKQYGIPGIAVGVTVGGRHYVFDYGVASKATWRPVDGATLFEIGSVSKTFTATLASYAGVTKKLSLDDDVSADFPVLRGTSFDRIRLLELGTHTSGGLPLQLPDDVANDAGAIAFYEHWKPAHAAGTHRLYSNTGIMLLGVVAAHRLGSDFDSAMRRAVFAPLGLHDTFLTVPPDRLPHYAQGYTSDDVPKRMTPGPLASEAYGVRTTAGDLLRFVDSNMDLIPVEEPLRRAIQRTHTAYYRLGAMSQDLIWEQYRDPVSLAALVRGNSNDVIFGDNAVVPIRPPSPPRRDVLINKTGSTNGFAAYVAFIPRRKTGVVLLANKSYPIEARVTTAYRILTRLRR